MKKLILGVSGLLVAVTFALPALSLAETTTTSAAQMSAVSSLLQQVQALQTQIDALKMSQTTLKVEAGAQIANFMSDLSVGSKGEDVKALQKFLAANPNLYPEGLITGFFGQATARAVMRFQKENGLEQAGRVGPKTREALNKHFGQNVFFTTGTMIATSTAGIPGTGPCAVFTRASAPGVMQLATATTVSFTINSSQPVSVSASPMPCNVVYGDIKEGRGFGLVSGTSSIIMSENLITPQINVIFSTSTATSTAYVFWTTNKHTKSTIWYATSTPLASTTPIKIEDNAFSMSHSVNIPGLSANTTYYYMIGIVDPRGNHATSSERSFTTLSN